MIVGFDNDDPSIFDEQFRFIQEARIPISMTGLLNAIPRTPLYTRLKKAGRLVAEHVGDQFIFTNVLPSGMSRIELYQGYKRLLQRLYDYGNYRQRAMALILNQGGTVHSHITARSKEVGIVIRLVWSCIVAASPRRSAMTLRILLETSLRRPRALRQAFALVLMHKHFHGYVKEISRQLDRLIRDLGSGAEAGLLPSPE